MSTKRLRVFAGPNGSGKTTIIKSLQSEIPFGIYVNADDIESFLKETNVLLFDTYQISVSEELIVNFLKDYLFSTVKINQLDLWKYLQVKNNILYIKTYVDSYLAADLAEFIRIQLVSNGLSLTYETVLSHPGKIDFIKTAKQSGYKIYLYYIATEDPEINISRVKIRVAQKGHHVNPEVIKKRYFRSLKLLKSVVKESNRAYLWDNSSESCILIAEITDGSNVSIIDKSNVPNWFIENLANQS